MDQFAVFIKQFLREVNPEYLIEIFLIYMIIYTFLRFMEGTRGEGILKGIALIMIFLGAAAIPALVIIVQPELRRALVRLGQTRLFGMLFKRQTEGMVDEIVKAVFRMSRRRVGALIALEREVGLQNYIERGTRIDG